MTDRINEDIKQGRRQIDELVADLRSQVTALQTELAAIRRPVEDGEVQAMLDELDQFSAGPAATAASIIRRLTQQLAEAKAERDEAVQELESEDAKFDRRAAIISDLQASLASANALLEEAKKILDDAEHALTTSQGCYATDINPEDRAALLANGNQIEWQIDDTKTLEAVKALRSRMKEAG